MYDIFMKEALEEARKSYEINEVPIGCVIVKDNEIIARGHNRRNTEKNVLAHAEIIAINEACKIIKDWRLEDCEMYVTLEPCPMCAGAIIQSRIKKVIFSAPNLKSGSCGTIIDILNQAEFNHQVEVEKDVLKEESSQLLKLFFKNLRKN